MLNVSKYVQLLDVLDACVNNNDCIRTQQSLLTSYILEIEDVLSIHANYRLDDPQYEDPEEWRLTPILEKLRSFKTEDYSNSCLP